MLHAAVVPSLPATAATHCVSGVFTPHLHPDEREVVVVRQNILTLYRYDPHTVAAGDASSSSLMRVVMETPLHAPPKGIAVCRPGGASVDVLVLLMDDFHLSFLQANPLLLQWDAVALVQLDDRPCMGEAAEVIDPIIRVDASKTQVAVLVRGSHLFFFRVLPKTKDGAVEVVAESSLSTTTAAGTVPQGGSADTPGVALDAWSDDEDEPNINNNNNSSNAPPAAEVGPTGSPTPAADSPPSAPITHDVLAMTSIAMLHLRSLEPRLRNVRDIAFVESTGEPLLAFLYEPQPVWAGHAKVVEWASKTVESRLLSCSIMWVKVALSAGGAADFLAIGDIHHLPFNTTHLVAVPAFHQVPSAVMGFGPNVCVHVSTKSVFGAYWNEAGHEEAKCAPNANNLYHPMTWMDPGQERSQELIRTNLDLANCTVVPLTTTSHAVELSFLVFTEEAGTVLELVVSADEYKVSTMRARIVMADCFCSCWAAVGADAFFLGSSRDDSRLVVYDRRAPSLTVRQSFWGLGPIQDMDVVDGTSDVKELCGRFVNEDVEQSPYAALYQSVVLEPAPLMTTAKKREVMDVALCTGLHSAGALSVLRHSIRDKVLRKESVNATSVFYIPSSSTTTSSTATDGADQQQQQQQQRKRGREDRRGGGRDDSHLLLTGRNFSLWFLVRRAGLQQVKTFALDMNARTILATSLGWASAVLQVTGTELRLVSVDGKQKLHTLALEPFLGEETAGSDGEKTQVSAAILLPSMQSLILRSTNGKLLECSLKDVKDPNLSCKVIATDVVAVAAWEARQRLVVMQTHQLVFLDATSDGAWRSVARFPCFDALPPFALDGIEAVSAGGTKTRASSRNPAITITHMAVHPSSSPNAVVEAVLVVVTSSGELQTYNFHPKDVHGPQRLLKDLHHLLDVRADNDAIESIEAKKQRLLEEKARLAEEADQARNTSARLAAFHDLNGHDGIYACGQHPIFLMEEADSGRLALHHHKVADAVRGFSPFPSMELPHGYMYCSEGAVHVATMQTFGSSIGHGWWMKRVPLHATPHHVVYHPAAQACCVVTSHPAPFSPKKAPFDVQMKVYVDEEGKKHSSIVSAVALPPIPSNAGLPVPLNDRFQLRLLSCSDWSCADVLELQENERVLMAQCVEIDRQTALDASAAPTRAPIFAIATAFPLGEDVISRGRILLVAVQHRPSDGKAHFTMLHAENTQGPVTALCAMEGHIAVAVGGTIRVLHYDTIKSQLTTVSMLYAGAYVSRLTAFREYLIVGDLYHSATMVRFSATNHTLTVLGKDYNNFSIVEASMLFQDRAFGIITTDSDRNLCVLGYTPKVFGAEGGSAKKPAKVMQAQFSVDAEFRSPGGSVVKMLRLPSLSPSSSLGLYCTNYGEVGYLVPVSEQSNKTAQWVATRVEMDAAHVGGLAPSLFLGLSQTDARHAIRAKERLIYTPLLDVLLRMDLPMRSTTAARALTQLDRVARIRSSILEECRAVL